MRVLAAVLIAYLFTASPLLAEDAAEASADETLLRSSQIGVEAHGLLDYLRSLLPRKTPQATIDRDIADLGAEEYRRREEAASRLIGYGPAAVASLKQAAGSPDLETRRRAERCLEAIKAQRTSAVLAAAVRLLEERAVKGAQVVLVELLPHAGSAEVEEQLVQTLVTLVKREPRGAGLLMPALQDREPLRRGAAALVIGRFGNDNERRAVRPLWNDRAPLVRFRAAAGLLAARERDAFPVLIDLLKDPQLGTRAQELLTLVVVNDAPRLRLDDNNTRAVHAAWHKWWQDNAQRTDLLANVEEALEIDGLVQRQAVVFVRALERGELETLQKLSDTPYILGEMQQPLERAELDKMLAQVVAILKPAKFTVVVERRTLTPTAEQAAALPWKNDTIRLLRARVNIQENSEVPDVVKVHKFLLLFRVRAGAAKMVGVIEDRDS